jgi:hypothetical protein
VIFDKQAEVQPGYALQAERLRLLRTTVFNRGDAEKKEIGSMPDRQDRQEHRQERSDDATFPAILAILAIAPETFSRAR